jgi:hypothetical protein
MSTKTFDVFISHSSKDAETAAAIKKRLHSSGIRCWKAPDDILPGESWPEAILRAIADSKTMILVWSAHSKSSNEVGKELTLGMRHNLTVVPFRIENVPASGEWEYHLANTHWMDAFAGVPDQHFDLLAAHMAKLLPEGRKMGELMTEKPATTTNQIATPKLVSTPGSNPERLAVSVELDRPPQGRHEMREKSKPKKGLVRRGFTTIVLIFFVILVVSAVNDFDKQKSAKIAGRELVAVQNVDALTKPAADEIASTAQPKIEDKANAAQPLEATKPQRISPPPSVEARETRSDVPEMQQPINEVFAAWRNLDFSRYIAQWAPHARKVDLKSGKNYNFQELFKEREKDFGQYKAVRADTIIKLRQSDAAHATFDVWYEMEFTRKTGKVLREKAKESYMVVKTGKQWLIELNRDYEAF